MAPFSDFSDSFLCAAILVFASPTGLHTPLHAYPRHHHHQRHHDHNRLQGIGKTIEYFRAELEKTGEIIPTGPDASKPGQSNDPDPPRQLRSPSP